MSTRQRLTGKRLRELLAVKKIYNDFGLMGDTAPVISLRKRDLQQNVLPAWQVLHAGRRTDPDGHYRDGFNKTFAMVGDVTNDFKNARLADAQAWVTERYGVAEWAKTPYGSWTSGEKLDVRLRELLPEFFNSGSDSIVNDLIEKIHGDGDSTERLFRVVVQIYAKPESPLYVRAVDADAARRQVVQLFTRLAGTRVLDGLRINVYDA